MRRETKGGRSWGLAAAVIAAALALPGMAEAQPRPWNLQHLAPASLLDVGTHFGEIENTSALAFPLALQARLGPQVLFLVDGPFGYINEPGNPAAPVLGNIGVGARYIGVRGRRGRPARFVWAATLMGRVPTAPGIDATYPSAPLRFITPYHGERWSPQAGAVRADLSVGHRWTDFALEGEFGVTAHLPLDEDAATVGVHWGVLAAGRPFRRAWIVLEAVGTDLAPGLPGAAEGHLVSLVPGFRIDLGGAQPGFFVSVPVAGPEEAPVVFAVSVTAF